MMDVKWHNKIQPWRV